MQAFPLVLFPVLGDAIQRLLKFGTFFKSLALRISSLRDPTSSTCSLWCYIQLRFLALVGFSTSWIFPFYCDSFLTLHYFDPNAVAKCLICFFSWITIALWFHTSIKNQFREFISSILITVFFIILLLV